MKIYHSRGVYPNGDYKDNGVAEDDIISHIWYNITFRPGRAFFVNGFCLNRGFNITEELFNLHDKVVVEQTKVTAPYV